MSDLWATEWATDAFILNWIELRYWALSLLYHLYIALDARPDSNLDLSLNDWIYNDIKKSKKSHLVTLLPDDKEDVSYVRRFTPNPKLPWCPACKRHTDYHLKVIGRDRKTGVEETASFYTCDECGGKAWKPTYPLALNLVSLLIFGFLLWITIYALLDVHKDPRRLILPLVTLLAGSGLYNSVRKNTAHWRQFKAWAKSKDSLWKVKETGLMLTLIMFWAAPGKLMPWNENQLWQHLGNKALEFSK